MILATLMAVMLPAIADTPKDRVTVEVRMQVTNADGRDGGSVFGRLSSLEPGKQESIFLSRGAGYCGGGVRFGTFFDSETVTGWRVQVTPLKVDEMNTVTFRLAWSRAVVDGRPSGQKDVVAEVTLRPGQSVPLDVQPWAVHAKPECGTNQAAIVIAVAPWPADMDRQLALTDLWLVDKAADGTEKTQRLTLRGRFGDPQPFFFDDISAGGETLDLSGEVLVLAREDGVALQITTLRRRPLDDFKLDRASATTRVHLRPTDTAGVELPKTKERGPDPFQGHQLSLRIQSREIRPAAGPQPQSAFAAAPPVKREH